MAALGVASLRRLQGCKALTISRAEQLALLATGIGIDFTIPEYGGLRDDATQAQLLRFRDDSVAAGGAWYAVAPIGKSHHLTGDAFDIELLTYPDTMSESEAYAAVGAFAGSIGLRWGGDFPRPDIYHYENAEPWTGEVAAAPATEPAGFTTGEIIAGVLVTAAVLYFIAR
jgi:hypothetical protein